MSEDPVEKWLERLMMFLVSFLALTEWNPWLRFLLCWFFFILAFREVKRWLR